LKKRSSFKPSASFFRGKEGLDLLRGISQESMIRLKGIPSTTDVIDMMTEGAEIQGSVMKEVKE
jgi:hypothetical protein